MTERHPSADAEFDARTHYQSESVASAYDRARFRDPAGTIVHALERRIVLRGLRALGDVRTVLDLPSGTGRFLRPLQRSGFMPIAADVSPAMLSRARERADAPLVVSDAESLPIRDAAVDAVMCIRLFPHLDAQSRAGVLSEIARVSRTGAVVVCQPERRSLWYLVRNKIQRRRLPRHYASDAELRREFQAAGLRVAKSYTMVPLVFMERAYVLVPV
jgi:ubiquinone/menaquinone biosynthesis C-methylase UbiE